MAIEKTPKHKYAITNFIKKTGHAAHQSIKQSPDADLLLASAIGTAFITSNLPLTLLLGAASIKQYLWGWLAYTRIQNAINKKEGEVSVEALKKTYSVRRQGPCWYFGAKYAIKKFQKNSKSTLEQTLEKTPKHNCLQQTIYPTYQK